MGRADIMRMRSGDRAWPEGPAPGRQRWSVALLILTLHVGGGWLAASWTGVDVASSRRHEAVGISETLVMVRLAPLSQAPAAAPPLTASPRQMDAHSSAPPTHLERAPATSPPTLSVGAQDGTATVQAAEVAVSSSSVPAVVVARSEPAVRLTQPARPAPGNALPRYPDAAREDGLEGTVRLLVELAADGTVKAVRWAIRSGVPLLDQTAREAVRQWHFLPAWQDGVAVAAVVPVTLQFRLQGDTVWLAQAGGSLP